MEPVLIDVFSAHLASVFCCCHDCLLTESQRRIKNVRRYQKRIHSVAQVIGMIRTRLLKSVRVKYLEPY